MEYYWSEETWEAAHEWAAKGFVKAEARRLRRALLHLEEDLFETRGEPCHGFLQNYIPRIPAGDDKALERAKRQAARLRGWLLAASEAPIPGGKVLLEAECLQPVYSHSPAQMGRGGLPYAIGTSPWRITRHIWRVYRRAEGILRPMRWKPSRRAVEAALRTILEAAFDKRRLPRIGKLARQVAAASLPWGRHLVEDGGDKGVPWFEPPCFYRGSARKVLVRARGFGRRVTHDPAVFPLTLGLVRRTSLTWAEAQAQVLSLLYEGEMDAEGWWVAPHPLTSVHGVQVHLACTPWTNTHLQSRYISGLGLVIKTPNHPEYHWDDWGYPSPVKEAVREAISAWRRQRQAEKDARRQRRAISRLLAASYLGITGLQVTIQDSLKAGNCLPGTLRWCREHGIQGEKVPVWKLAPYKNDPAVRRVLAVVWRR